MSKKSSKEYFCCKIVLFQPNTDKDEVIVNQDGMYKVEIKYHIRYKFSVRFLYIFSHFFIFLG